MRRTTILRTVFAVIAIAFFATPIALRAVGVTADAFENRPFAAAPKLSQGWDVFEQTTRFLTDRMPLREQAVRANTEISQNVFGTTPRYGGGSGDTALPFAGAEQGSPATAPPSAASQVLEGESGWLYLQGELDRACAPTVPTPQALATWRGIVAAIRASGRPSVLLVAPDKASVYPEHVPAGARSAGCALAQKRRFWDELDGPGAGGAVLGLRDALLARKEEGPDPVHLREDSHWTQVGALELVRAALRSLGGRVRVRDGEVRDTGPTGYQGDLTILLGTPRNDTQPTRSVVRAPGSPVVPGRTLIVRDSYGDAPMPLLRPYFADLREILWVGSTQEELVRAIAAADRVILETVEREFAYRAGPPGPANDALAAALRSGLTARR